MNKFRALAGLRYPDGPAEVQKAARAKSSDELKAVKWKSVSAGSVVSDIPEVSVPWLLKQGRIEPVLEKVK